LSAVDRSSVDITVIFRITPPIFSRMGDCRSTGLSTALHDIQQQNISFNYGISCSSVIRIDSTNLYFDMPIE